MESTVLKKLLRMSWNPFIELMTALERHRSQTSHASLVRVGVGLATNSPAICIPGIGFRYSREKSKPVDSCDPSLQPPTPSPASTFVQPSSFHSPTPPPSFSVAESTGQNRKNALSLRNTGSTILLMPARNGQGLVAPHPESYQTLLLLRQVQRLKRSRPVCIAKSAQFAIISALPLTKDTTVIPITVQQLLAIYPPNPPCSSFDYNAALSPSELYSSMPSEPLAAEDYHMLGLSPPPMTSPAPSPSIPSASLRRDSSSSAGRSTRPRHATPVPLSRTVSRSGSVSDWEVMYELGLPRPGTIDYAYSPAASPLSPSNGFASAPSQQSTTRKTSVTSSSGSRSRHGSPAPSYRGAPSPAASVRSPLGQ
ncbi:hypothetical protein BT96DRAFT_1000736 [Gymnopus androsaceus JB14]|uniref:Uncharacterized protein n=1 Tax=Gymnopus androsaceus JB14 TaxID=1447944 RepID=A0A6A4H423_9AGAR|nr:hypothetical protein BT96DRAFT_1000736 [Gymnopus androsaceus JB14]